jgi:hypothetical protein
MQGGKEVRLSSKKEFAAQTKSVLDGFFFKIFDEAKGDIPIDNLPDGTKVVPNWSATRAAISTRPWKLPDLKVPADVGVSTFSLKLYFPVPNEKKPRMIDAEFLVKCTPGKATKWMFGEDIPTEIKCGSKGEMAKLFVYAVDDNGNKVVAPPGVLPKLSIEAEGKVTSAALRRSDSAEFTPAPRIRESEKSGAEPVLNKTSERIEGGYGCDRFAFAKPVILTGKVQHAQFTIKDGTLAASDAKRISLVPGEIAAIQLSSQVVAFKNTEKRTAAGKECSCEEKDVICKCMYSYNTKAPRKIAWPDLTATAVDICGNTVVGHRESVTIKGVSNVTLTPRNIKKRFADGVAKIGNLTLESTDKAKEYELRAESGDVHAKMSCIVSLSNRVVDMSLQTTMHCRVGDPFKGCKYQLMTEDSQPITPEDKWTAEAFAVRLIYNRKPVGRPQVTVTPKTLEVEVMILDNGSDQPLRFESAGQYTLECEYQESREAMDSRSVKESFEVAPGPPARLILCNPSGGEKKVGRITASNGASAKLRELLRKPLLGAMDAHGNATDLEAEGVAVCFRACLFPAEPLSSW